MSEKITLTVIPSGLLQDSLEVKEAFQEVVDILKLAGKGKDSSKDFFWKLVSISMNSPLCIVAEAASNDEDFDVDSAAREQKDYLNKTINNIIDNNIQDEGLDDACKNIALRIFKRAHETLGGFVIDLHDDGKEIKVLPQTAIRARKSLENIKPVFLPGDRSHQEIGEVEGKLFQFVPHYKNPTINIIDLITGHIVKCKFSSNKSIGLVKNITLLDMAMGKHVVVSGTIFYNSEGIADKVISDEIRILEDENMPYESIVDTNFTNSLGVFEYLSKWTEE